MAIRKRPHLPEAGLYCLRNAVSATMAKAGRPKKATNPEKKSSQRSGHESVATDGPVHLVSTKKQALRALKVGTVLNGATRIRISNHYATVLYMNIVVYI